MDDTQEKKKRGRPKKEVTTPPVSDKPKRPVGRPRKYPEGRDKARYAWTKAQGRDPMIDPNDILAHPGFDKRKTNLDPGDNTAFLEKNITIALWKKCDIRNPEELRQRIIDYWKLLAEHDMKTSNTSLALALGIDRHALKDIVTQTYRIHRPIPEECRQILEQAFLVNNAMWEDYMVNGKINPVAGIYLGNNNFGYTNEQQVVVTPNTEQNNLSIEDIRSRYAIEAEEQEALPAPEPESTPEDKYNPF